MKFEANTTADLQAIIKNRRDLEQALRFFRLEPNTMRMVYPKIPEMKLVAMAVFGYWYREEGEAYGGRHLLAVDMTWTSIYPGELGARRKRKRIIRE